VAEENKRPCEANKNNLGKASWSSSRSKIPMEWLLCCLGLGIVAICFFYLYQSQSAGIQLWDPELRPEYYNEPLGKKTVRYFDRYLMARAGIDDAATFRANVNRALAPNIEFESVAWGPEGGPLHSYGRDEWQSSGEEKKFRTAFGSTELFTQMLFFGENATATTTSYGTLFWGGDLFGMRPPNAWIELRVCDFYRIERDSSGIYGGLITYNFMMIDWADVVHRAGLPVLPPAALVDGVVLPPAANDGVPAPFSILAQQRDTEGARVVARSILKDWEDTGTGQGWDANLTFYGPRGIGLARGRTQFQDYVLKPFQAAFSDRLVESEILTCEGNYCACMGHINGTHVGTWLGLTASDKRVSIRYGMHWRFLNGKAVEGWAIFDVSGLYRQLGFDFFATASNGSLQHITSS
jgi:predicted ester cyclase